MARVNVAHVMSGDIRAVFDRMEGMSMQYGIPLETVMQLIRQLGDSGLTPDQVDVALAVFDGLNLLVAA